MKWTPDLVIALTVVVGCIILIATGINSEVKAIFGMSAVWAFGRGYQGYRIAKEATRKHGKK